jgi:hypothetical protein
VLDYDDGQVWGGGAATVAATTNMGNPGGAILSDDPSDIEGSRFLSPFSGDQSALYLVSIPKRPFS